MLFRKSGSDGFTPLKAGCRRLRLDTDLKKEIEICKYIKHEVSAMTWVKISNYLVFHEVLIYYYINNLIKLWNTGY